MVCLGNKQIILLLLRLHPSTAFQTLVDYDGYSVSAKGFLPTVVYINSPIPVHFSSLIPKMLMFALAISCLTTFSLPWFIYLTLQVPMQYCSLQHRTLLSSPVTFTTGCCFCFCSISSFFPELFLHCSSVVYWAPTDLGSSSFSVLYIAFSYCSWGSQGKNNEVVCHSLPQWTTFCQNFPPWPVCLGWPLPAWLIVSLS